MIPGLLGRGVGAVAAGKRRRSAPEVATPVAHCHRGAYLCYECMRAEMTRYGRRVAWQGRGRGRRQFFLECCNDEGAARPAVP